MSQQKQEDKEPPFVPQYFGTQQPKRNVKPRPMPAPEDLEPLRELFRHQIESFDYMADAGLSILFDSIKPVQIHDSFSNRTLKISFENPKLFPPMKDRSSSSSALSSSKSTFREFLYPYECRQFKSSYTGALMAEVCFQYDDGPVIRERFNFGQFPIMLKVRALLRFVSFRVGFCKIHHMNFVAMCVYVHHY